MANKILESYADFLSQKRLVAPTAGITPGDLPACLFPFQRDLVQWALRKGRAAIFADTGLGKTLMQLAWAMRAGNRVLLVAPLAVAAQTVAEARERLGVHCQYSREQAGANPTGLTITNYERLECFDPSTFDAVVLDESSILKNFEGKTRNRLIAQFRQVPMRLCCTATPAPNDIAELANHAEFLGVMTRTEILAAFFIHDDKGWRLKGHAREAFYRWLASWGMAIRKPSDLGYDDQGFDLPTLSIQSHFVPCDYVPEGMLFAVRLKGITERSKVRRATIAGKVQRAMEIVEQEPGEPWLIWCGLNDESEWIASVLPGAWEVKGTQSAEEKEQALLGFARGTVKRLVTKPKIAGFGMNWQHCARVLYLGLSDSWEQYYQTIRRCWRFGQKRHVIAHIVLSEGEHEVIDNINRKERQALQAATELISYVKEYEREEVQGIARRSYTGVQSVSLPGWINDCNRSEDNGRIRTV